MTAIYPLVDALVKVTGEEITWAYDYIFIDVPPTINDFSDNAMMAADYVLIILQAQELSLDQCFYVQMVALTCQQLSVRRKCLVMIT